MHGSIIANLHWYDLLMLLLTFMAIISIEKQLRRIVTLLEKRKP